LGLLTLAALAGCGPSGPPASSARPIELPRSVVVDDGIGRKIPLRIGSLVEGGRLTAEFGERRGSMGGGSDGHRGIDIAAPKGTPVRAAADGRIAEVGRAGGYGRIVRIRHSRDVETAYAHLSRFARTVEVGRPVRQGEVIGYVGASGQASGPHLHFEVSRFGRQIDPLALPPARRPAKVRVAAMPDLNRPQSPQASQ
jgi:murein DD-endopeptidase MepM/ murein hydrolase activator NlpD